MCKRYEFGKNWLKYLDKGFSKEKVEVAQKHLLDFLKLSDLQDRVFLDIGCGSGIHSLAAVISGAKKVISVDIDENSIEATKKVWTDFGCPDSWEIIQGSVLDKEFMQSLEHADIVYSWGVLHHTGNMFESIRNVGIPLKENGVLYIALYADEMYQNPSPQYWIELKKKYNAAPKDVQKRMETQYAWDYVLKGIAERGENPLQFILDYKKSRGMEFWTDVRDWLGGYPMEFAKASEIAQFVKSELDLNVIDVKSGEGNTEYLITKDSVEKYFRTSGGYFEITIPKENIKSLEGNAYSFLLPELATLADSEDDGYSSPVLVYEDGILLGFPHAKHVDIKKKGEGRFSHWGDSLLFSAHDNGDPRSNGKTYTIFSLKQ